MWLSLLAFFNVAFHISIFSLLSPGFLRSGGGGLGQDRVLWAKLAGGGACAVPSLLCFSSMGAFASMILVFSHGQTDTLGTMT